MKNDRQETLQFLYDMSPEQFHNFTNGLFGSDEVRSAWWNRLFYYSDVVFGKNELISCRFSHHEITMLCMKFNLLPNILSTTQKSSTGLYEIKTSAHQSFLESSVLQIKKENIEDIRVEGRSVLIKFFNASKLLVLKLQKKKEEPSLLMHEFSMMRKLLEAGDSDEYLHPIPLEVAILGPDTQLQLLAALSYEQYALLNQLADLSSSGWAVLIYTVSPDYFHYINDPGDSIPDFSQHLTTVFSQLFKLAKEQNLYHCDLMSLFHRSDKEVYSIRGDAGEFVVSTGIAHVIDGPMGGYAPEALQYPNLSVGGIRDLKQLHTVTTLDNLSHGIYSVLKLLPAGRKRKFTFIEVFAKYLFVLEAMITSRSSHVTANNIDAIINAVTEIFIKFMELSSVPRMLCENFVLSLPIRRYVEEIIFWSNKANRSVSEDNFREKVSTFHPGLRYKLTPEIEGVHCKKLYGTPLHMNRIGYPHAPYPILLGPIFRYALPIIMLSICENSYAPHLPLNLIAESIDDESEDELRVIEAQGQRYQSASSHFQPATPSGESRQNRPAQTR